MKRDTRITLRITEDEKRKIKELVEAYGMEGSLSEWFRMVVAHIDEKRPVLAVKISPKGKGE